MLFFFFFLDLFSVFYAKNYNCVPWYTDLPPAPHVWLLIFLIVRVQAPTIFLMDHYNCFPVNILDPGVLPHPASLHFPVLQATPRVIILK